MEAILLAGGKAERLGDAASGRPKALVHLAGKPLATYQIGRLAAAGVDRVIVSCAGSSGRRSQRRSRSSSCAGENNPRHVTLPPSIKIGEMSILSAIRGNQLFRP